MKTTLSTKLANLADFGQEFTRKAPKRPNNSIAFVCMLGSIAITTAGYSAERSETTVRNEITQWMKSHPVMGTQARTISKIQNHPDATTPGAVSVVSLSPAGSVVVNRDTRLPMIAIFTAETTVEDPRIFDVQVAHAARILQTLGTYETYAGVPTNTTSNVYVPALLKTQWGQWGPYNSDMPFHSKMAGPAVTGCGTIGFAQVLNHYQWPPYGEGTRTHRDTAGIFNPTFSTNFEQAYRWDLMKNSYDANTGEPAKKAVAQLAYDVAVLGSIDCEYNVSGINLDLTGNNLKDYLFYERENLVIGDLESRQVIEENLLKGIPVPADITITTEGAGHAVVFDGLLVNNGTTSYHTNYGWYGSHNFWWDKDALLAVWQAKPGIRPALIPLPKNRNLVAKQGEPLKLPWKIATQRQADAMHLNLYQEVLKNGPWVDDCESLPAAVEIRTWTLDYNGVSGTCWKANSPYPAEYLTFVDEFVPTEDSIIEFQEKHVCGDNYMAIEVSVSGDEFQPILTIGKEIRNTWQNQRVSLASFSGKTIKIRVKYCAPPYSSYYSTENGGGIWIDNMRVTNTLVKHWDLVDTIASSEIKTNGQDCLTTHPKFQNLPIGTYHFSASLTDANNIEHRAGSSVTLTVAKTGETREKFQVLLHNKPKLSGTSLRMGSTKVDEKRITNLVIKNTGTTTMKAIQLKTLGIGRNAYTVSVGNTTLAPGEKTTLRIQFKPNKVGASIMNVKISTSANTSFRLRVNGKGKE